MNKTLTELADEFSKSMRCNCDLDNWQPEQSTGHSHVCRIHKASVDRWHDRDRVPPFAAKENK